jgi:hypothetical protein
VGGVGKSVVTNAITTALPRQQVVTVPEKKALLNGFDNVPAVSEKNIAPPVSVFESVVHSENVTMERPKGKLGGAQRVTRGAAENKKVIIPFSPRAVLTVVGRSLHSSHTPADTASYLTINEGTQISDGSQYQEK